MSCRSSESRYHARRGHGGRVGHFFGLDVEEMSPNAMTVAASAVLVPVALSGLFLVAFAPGFWWIFTTYFWVAFPAFGLLARGLAGSSERRTQAVHARSAEERELLETLWREGEISPVRAALGTSLSVAEADHMLAKLAEAGHLRVRVRGGGLLYVLWEEVEPPALQTRQAVSRKSGETASQEVLSWPE